MNESDTLPLEIMDDDLDWKIHLNYDMEAADFLVWINDKKFSRLPFLAEIATTAP